MSSFNNITLKDKEIKIFIIEDGQNPTAIVRYYRIWSNGFVEQFIKSSANYGNGVFANQELHIPLSSDYPIVATATPDYRTGSGFTNTFSLSFQYVLDGDRLYNKFYVYIRMADGALPPLSVTYNAYITGFNMNYKIV